MITDLTILFKAYSLTRTIEEKSSEYLFTYLDGRLLLKMPSVRNDWMKAYRLANAGLHEEIVFKRIYLVNPAYLIIQGSLHFTIKIFFTF